MLRWALLTAKAATSCTAVLENALQRIFPAWRAVYGKKGRAESQTARPRPGSPVSDRRSHSFPADVSSWRKQERPDSLRLTSITVKSRRLCGLRRIKRRLMHTLRGSNETGVRHVLVLRANVTLIALFLVHVVKKRGNMQATVQYISFSKLL